MSRGEHPAWRIRLNHLLANSLRATIAASRGLRHQNRRARHNISKRHKENTNTRNKSVDKVSALKQPKLEQYTYIVT